MELFTLLFNEYWDTLETAEEPASPEEKTGKMLPLPRTYGRNGSAQMLTMPATETTKTTRANKPDIPAGNCWRKRISTA